MKSRKGILCQSISTVLNLQKLLMKLLIYNVYWNTAVMHNIAGLISPTILVGPFF